MGRIADRLIHPEIQRANVMRVKGISMKKWIIIFTMIVLFPSCTIATPQIRNILNSNTTHNHHELCDIRFSIFIKSNSRTNTYGMKEDKQEWVQRLRDKYIKSTINIFKQEGCSAAYAENDEDANFIIRVERLQDLSALPQEYLTGLSFGLIPSWGTRPSQFVYSFEDTRSARKHKYVIDVRSYNHLVLFPFFWVNFITATELGVYEKCITNFIE